MASCKLYSVLLAAVVLAVGPATRPVSAATHLHFYMHDVLTGSAPTAVQVLNGPRGHMGDTIVVDDVLTASASRSSSMVGRAQGQFIWASTGNLELLVTMNVVFSSGGPYAGSSVTVGGRDDVRAPVRELSVVGGTGQFRMARGYVLWKTVSLVPHHNAVLELDVYVM
ncbi:hypothetical protein BDA96_05G216900 [Sorghum bicolor]|uniref:Dirigent protein n=2 Tax=Sorghum bicolor TaxID=4558 RepID=A0A921UGG2_SORBI|nr:dirigent protein 21-like [Sorghum bicolor]KAG0530788.1 hypothetical protein BDA96_05G216900 [Sorghum bicolor]KXG29027.1 hypothetical protein SORBI_3005G200700 [Sorghum bicolor]|eukprot:XP_021317525.1 dirigent protein 21-like [Sorghum bicolor]